MADVVFAERVPVWDRFVRVFHWSLVICISASFVTAYSGDTLVHLAAGYILLILICARIAWGFIGPEHARFVDFVKHPAQVIRYLADHRPGRKPERHLGHNPAAGWVAAAQIGLVTVATFSGVAVQGMIEYSGPLWYVLAGLSDNAARAGYTAHVFAANCSLALIALHLVGVLVSSFTHRENLVAAMIHGKKKPNPPNPH